MSGFLIAGAQRAEPLLLPRWTFSVASLGHIALTVQDMDKSLRFYCDILGFEKAFEIRDDQNNP
jgi:catechol-2,3-dioxygenase